MMKGLLISTLLCAFALSTHAQRYRMPFPEPIQSPDPIPGPGMLIDRPFGYYNLTADKGEFALIIGYQYEQAYGFIKSVALARVKHGGKWGYISVDGYPTVKCIYDDAMNFDDNGYAMVKLDDKWGIIDKHGVPSVPCVYDTMDDLCNGWFEVSRDGAWGYISNTGIYASSHSEYEQKKNSLGKSK